VVVAGLLISVLGSSDGLCFDLVVDDMLDFRFGKKLRSIHEVNAAKEALRTGDAAKCRELLETVCKSLPDTPHPTVLFVGFLLEDRQEQSATDALAELSLDPEAKFEAHFAFGRLAGKQGRWQDAWAHLLVAEQAPKPDRWSPEYWEAVQANVREVKSIVAIGRRDWNVARRILLEVTGQRPQDPQVLRRLAICSFHLKDVPAAKDFFQKASTADDNDQLPVPVRLANLYLQTDSPDARQAAESLFKQACKDPGKPGQLARIQYGAWLLGQNRAQDLLAVLQDAPFDESLAREQSYLLGLANRMLGDYLTAREHFMKLSNSEPGNIRISNQLALVLIEDEDDKSAARALEIALRNASRLQTEATLGTLAWIRFRRGETDEAHKILNSLTRSSTVSRDVAFYYSQSLKAKGRGDEAEKMIQVVRKSAGPFYYSHQLAP
jgi:hypothetical protein